MNCINSPHCVLFLEESLDIYFFCESHANQVHTSINGDFPLSPLVTCLGFTMNLETGPQVMILKSNIRKCKNSSMELVVI